MRMKLKVVTLSSLLLVLATAHPATAQSAEVVLPPPAPGSFISVFDYLKDGRVVAFDGFTVFVQASLDSPELTAIGTLPEAFLGGTDPGFVVVSGDGRKLILGGGAGGSRFPDPAFNGNIFEMPAEGGVASLLGTFPFHIEATFRRPDELVFGQGETFGTLTGSVELIDLDTGRHVTLVGDVPGDPSGVVFDAAGNLYVGLGFGQDQARTGEIRRFPAADVRAAIRTGAFLDFDTRSSLVSQILSASHFSFDPAGHLFVGGGDFVGTTGSFGFYAQVDVGTGEVVGRFDPTDGDPNDQDFVFFTLASTPAGCRLGAVDTFSFFGTGVPRVFERSTCTP